MYIVTGLSMGGAEQQVCLLADEFAKQSDQVLLISMTGLAVCAPSSTSVLIEELRMERSLFSFIRAFLQVVRLMWSFRPDVVHSHMVHANIFARMLRLVVRVPRLISTAHSSNEGGWFRMFAYRATDFLTDLTTNVSHSAVDSFLQKKASRIGRIKAVHNGIDLHRFKFSQASRDMCRDELGIDSSVRLVVSVGRLELDKDYPNLINAFALSKQQAADLELVIIGVGSLKDELQNMVTKLGIEHCVHFLGLRFNVEDWMCGADLYVLSSAWEGFGLVLAEAMACERVVVATDCGGVKEVVGPFGRLVAPQNSEFLSATMLECLSFSKDENAVIGKSSRGWIESNFSIKAISREWRALYSKDLTENN
ncbi:glycosyltransferase [Pseudomonadales bacterium]|nr:glycosyltransferase [Pseudomonadales bacterium]